MKDKFDKIDAKKGEYEPEAQAEMEGWKKTLQDATAIRELRNHFAIQDFLVRLENQMHQMDEQLRTNRTMSQEERDKVFIRKDIMNEFIGIFTSAAELEKSIIKQIDEL